MISRVTQIALTIGLTIGGAATCSAQSEAPITSQERAQEVGPATQDRLNQERTMQSDQDRTIQRERIGDRTIVKERVVERRHEGETYVGGFGGFTWGHSFDNAEGTGSDKGTPRSQGLDNSIVYGGKIGYFFPERYNWLGLEAEGFNTTAHLQQGSGLIGSNL